MKNIQNYVRFIWVKMKTYMGYAGNAQN